MIGWQAVTFYTTGTGYEQELRRLVESATERKVPLRTYPCAATGSWRGNLNHKSAMILKAFEDFPDKDIVFLDADAQVMRWPALFDELSAGERVVKVNGGEKRIKFEYDISACFYSYTKRSGDKDELLSGTLWIRNAEIGRAVVRRWHEIGLARPDVRHQYCLKLAILELERSGVPVRVFRHPFAYTCIFDYPGRGSCTPVIVHYQASRRLRRSVGYGQPLIVGASRGAPPASAAVLRMRQRNLDIMRKHFGEKETL